MMQMYHGEDPTESGCGTDKICQEWYERVIKLLVNNDKRRLAAERAAQAVFTSCGLIAVFAAVSVTLYMVVKGVPALCRVEIGRAHV